MEKKYQLRRKAHISHSAIFGTDISYVSNNQVHYLRNVRIKKKPRTFKIIPTGNQMPSNTSIVLEPNSIVRNESSYSFRAGKITKHVFTPEPIHFNQVKALFIVVVFLFVLSTVLMGNKVNPVDGALGIANIIAEWGGTMSTGFKGFFENIDNALIEVEVVDTTGNFFTAVFGTIANFFKFFWNFLVVIFNFLIGIWNLALNVIKLFLKIIGSLMGIR